MVGFTEVFKGHPLNRVLDVYADPKSTAAKALSEYAATRTRQEIARQHLKNKSGGAGGS